jgi:hypothetical protein
MMKSRSERASEHPCGETVAHLIGRVEIKQPQGPSERDEPHRSAVRNHGVA